MKKMYLLLLAIALFCQSGLAQEFDRAKLDSFFSALDRNNKFMGSVAVSRQGKIIYAKSLGYADIAHKVKADRHTRYRIGSISKTFTAILILKAVEQDKLTLDQRLDKFFPKIGNASKITINQLLHHRSGIHNYTDDKAYLSWNTEAKTEEQMVSIIARGGSDFEPGSKFEYSNSNYLLLSYILEEVFKEPYADLLQQYIARPLNLRRTSLGGNIDPENDDAYSYVFEDGWKIQPETDVSVALGAGGVASTPDDLVKLSNALFTGQVLSSGSLTFMESLEDGYGMGLLGSPFDEMKGYGHNGGIDGFSSAFAHFANDNVSYALISNGTDYNNNDITIAVLSAVYGKPYDIPAFSHYKVSPEALDKYVGVFSSRKMPLKLTVSRQDDRLLVQLTGQPAFPLEPSAKDIFSVSRVGAILHFDPETGTVTLKQGGGVIKFTRE